MSSQKLWKTIFITGPTASGKTKLAIYLAKKFNGEIINADSRQVYKYLDIGSGKIDIPQHNYPDINQIILPRYKSDNICLPRYNLISYPDFNQIISGNHQGSLSGRHLGNISGNHLGKPVFRSCQRLYHLFSIAHPKRNYSLGKWLKDSERVVRKILRKNKLPIFCGGTILYLKAIKEGWVLPEVKPNYKLRKELEKKTNKELYQQIKKLDPKRAKTLDPNNKRRLIRALEIIYKLGKVPKIKKKPKYNLLVLAPYIEKEKLFKKIKQRLIQRVPGIIEEIKRLRKLGLSFERIISFGLEYKWFGLLLASHTRYGSRVGSFDAPVRPSLTLRLGHSPTAYPNLTRRTRFANKYAKMLDESLINFYIELCYQDIIRFAKRQLRELKKMEDVVWVKNQKEAVKIVENFLKN